MPFNDLLWALPAICLVGLLPGYSLATILVPRWRWWERLAPSPGLSAGIAGVLGLACHDLKIPFGAPIFLAVGLLFGAVAVFMLRRRARTPTNLPGLNRNQTAAILVTSLAIGLISVIAVVVTVRNQPVPPREDVSIHAAIATAIRSSADSLPLIPSPVDQSAFFRPRSGVEALGAVASQISGQGAPAVLLPIALLSLLLLPLSLALLAWETSGDWRIAFLAPAFTLALPLVINPIANGNYPLLVESTLVAAMVVAAARALKGLGPGNLAMLTAATGSMWVVHGTELATALLIGAPYLLSIFLKEHPRLAARRAAMILAACVVGALLVVLMSRLPHLPAPVIPAGAGPHHDTAAADLRLYDPLVMQHPDSFVHSVLRVVLGMAPAGIGLIYLYLLGIVLSLRERRLRWALCAQATLLLATFDSYTLGALEPLWKATFPWSLSERLTAVEYWLLPMICAVALTSIATAARRVDGYALGARPRGIRIHPQASAARVVLGLALMFAGSVVVGSTWNHFRAVHQAMSGGLEVVTNADVQAFRLMNTRLPPHSVVLVDGFDDAGTWIGALTQDVNYYSPQYLSEYRDDAGLVTLQIACANLPLPADVVGGVDAVYVGAVRRKDASHPWPPDCVAKMPQLKLLLRVQVGADIVSVYLVDHTAATPGP